MIQLHRLGRDLVSFHLNPDLIATIEAHPDTVVHLTTGVNLVVSETPAEVVAEVRSWRRSCLFQIHEAAIPTGVS